MLGQAITEFAVPRPVRPLVKAMLTCEYTYAYAAVCPLDGKFDSLVLPDVNTECMQIFLDEIARRYPNENIVMVMDGAGWHRSHSLTLAENLRLLLLPPYSPELNPVEHLWDELREKNFHNRVFDSIGALESHLQERLETIPNPWGRLMFPGLGRGSRTCTAGSRRHRGASYHRQLPNTFQRLPTALLPACGSA